VRQSKELKSVPINKLKEKRAQIFKKMLKYEDGIRGSLIKIYKMCNNRECECHSSNRQKHGLAYYISSSHHGKTKMLYVPLKMFKKSKKQLRDYDILCELLEEISEINREIYKLEKGLR
jgi:hypothetical protein